MPRGTLIGATYDDCTLLRRVVNNLKEHHTFKFDGIFEPGCTQEQVDRGLRSTLSLSCNSSLSNQLETPRAPETEPNSFEKYYYKC